MINEKDSKIEKMRVEMVKCEKEIDDKDKLLEMVRKELEETRDVEEITKENTEKQSRIEKLELELHETRQRINLDNLKELSTSAVARQMINSMESRVVLSRRDFDHLRKVLQEAMEMLQDGHGRINGLRDSRQYCN